jgi:glutaredoxin 3
VNLLLGSDVKIYIKPGCPWCVEALAYLNEKGYSFEKVDVTSDSSLMDEMRAIFGQTKAPSMIMADGLKLADFGVDELVPFLEEHGIKP